MTDENLDIFDKPFPEVIDDMVKRTFMYLGLVFSMFSFLLFPLSLIFLIPTILYLLRIPIAVTKRKEGILIPIVDFTYSIGYLKGLLTCLRLREKTMSQE